MVFDIDVVCPTNERWWRFLPDEKIAQNVNENPMSWQNNGGVGFARCWSSWWWCWFYPWRSWNYLVIFSVEIERSQFFEAICAVIFRFCFHFCQFFSLVLDVKKKFGEDFCSFFRRLFHNSLFCERKLEAIRNYFFVSNDHNCFKHHCFAAIMISLFGRELVWKSFCY